MWHLWIGRARSLGLAPSVVAVDFLNGRRWLTHGDFAWEAEVDFLAVVEHRLIPAKVLSELGTCLSGVISCW